MDFYEGWPLGIKRAELFYLCFIFSKCILATLRTGKDVLLPFQPTFILIQFWSTSRSLECSVSQQEARLILHQFDR